MQSEGAAATTTARRACAAVWFGHGLGCGTWEYGNSRLAPVEAGETAVAAVDITNSGFRASRETVQVYFLPTDDEQPVWLVGYTGAQVQAGETATVRVTCDNRMFRRWDETAGAWEGNGELLVARGLGDIQARLPLN